MCFADKTYGAINNPIPYISQNYNNLVICSNSDKHFQKLKQYE